MFWVKFESATPISFIGMFVIASVTFSDLIVDSIMVVQQRKNPKNGAEVLNTYTRVFMFSGALVGSILGGYMVQHFHPKWCFFIYSWPGLIVAVLSLTLSKEVD